MGPNQSSQLCTPNQHQGDLKNRMNCSRTIWSLGWIALGRYDEWDEFIPFFKSSWCKIACATRNWIYSVPQTAATTFAFFSVFTLLLLCSLGTVVFIFCTYFTEKYCLLYCVYCIVVLRKVTFRLGRKWWTVSNIRLAGEKWEKVIVFTKILKGKNTVQRTTSPDFRHLNKAVKKLEFC